MCGARVMSALPPKADTCSTAIDVALGQKRTLMGFAVGLRNVLVFDRNDVTFQALLESCHSSLVGSPMFTVRFERYLVPHADR
jgi:hypothetical protein